MKLGKELLQQGELERFGHKKIEKVSVLPLLLRPQRSYQQQKRASPKDEYITAFVEEE